jgi:uncharacterized protein
MKQIPCVALVWLALVTTVQAASFDCSKATTKVERIVCSDPELSKFDETINAKYKTVLLKTTEPDFVRHKQREWLKMRNSCQDAVCVRFKYRMRIDELTEREKELKDIRSRLGIPEYAKDKNPSFCTRLLDSVKNWNDVTEISPVVTTDSIDDSLLHKYLGQCDPHKFTKSVQIEGRIWDAYGLGSKSEEEREKHGISFITRKGYRLYQANVDNDPKNTTELILYGAGTIQQGADAFDTSVSLSEFKVIDTQNCRTTSSAQVSDVVNKTNSFVGLIQYENKIYVMNANYYWNQSLWGVDFKQWVYYPKTKITTFENVCSFSAKDQ